MSNIIYLEDLPKLDEDLIREAIYTRDNHENKFHLKWSPYKLYDATEKLTKFVSTFFKFNHHVAVYTISSKSIPVHIDYKRTIAYNYIIDPGGPDVKTSFYDLNDFSRNSEGLINIGTQIPINENYTPIESVAILPNVWHLINVSNPHGVSNIETVRFGITVSPN